MGLGGAGAGWGESWQVQCWLFVLLPFRTIHEKAFIQCGRGDGWLEYCGAAASAAGSCDSFLLYLDKDEAVAVMLLWWSFSYQPPQW
jgi:hypothetical protein